MRFASRPRSRVVCTKKSSVSIYVAVEIPFLIYHQIPFGRIAFGNLYALYVELQH